MPKTSISFICKGAVVRVPFEEIILISKTGNETMIQTPSSCYRTYHRLQELLNDLPVNQFFRIHRSYVINLHHVSRLSKTQVHLGTHCLPVTAYYRKQLCRRLQQILDCLCKFLHLHASRLPSAV